MSASTRRHSFDMKRRKCLGLVTRCLVLGAVSMAGTGCGALASARPSEAAAPSAASASGTAGPSAAQLAKLPLSFLENQGQMDSPVRYYTTGAAASIGFSDDGMQLVLSDPSSHGASGTNVAVEFVGAAARRPVAGDRQRARASFLGGSRPRAGVPTYGEVRYEALWPGIDASFEGDTGHLKSTYTVAPGADPALVRLRYRGAEHVRITSDGNLEIVTGSGSFTELAPVVYQDAGSRRRAVPSRYEITKSKTVAPEVGFSIGSYDPELPLVIDPDALVYASYLGGTSGFEFGFALAVDSSGAAYVAGTTHAADFPTTPGAFDVTYAGSSGNDFDYFGDVFVAKIDPTGANLVFATYLGGSGADTAFGVIVGSGGEPIVTGRTGSPEFPTTSGAYQPRYGGGVADAFVTRLNRTGTGLVYSTFIGARAIEFANALTADADENIFVHGRTGSSDFPTSAGAFDRVLGPPGDTFVAKLSADGSSLFYSTYLGGDGVEREGGGIAVDPAGNAYVTGTTESGSFPTTPGAFDRTFGGGVLDAYVSKISPDGSELLWSTYLGGNGTEREGDSIGLDDNGFVYVSTNTTSSNFPTTAGVFQTQRTGDTTGDVAVTKFRPDGSLVWSTFIGGGRSFGLIVDKATGRTYVGGETDVASFPTTPGAFQRALNGSWDMFLTLVNPTGTDLEYSTYLGGSGIEGHLGDDAVDVGFGIAMDAAGALYITGGTTSSDFPITPGAPDPTVAGGIEAFVAKIDPDVEDTTLPSLSIGDKFAHEPAIDTRTAKFVVELSKPSLETVTVHYATADGTAKAPGDYVAASGVLTFAPGQTVKAIKITIKQDSTPEPREIYSVNLDTPTNATISSGSGRGEIRD